MFDDLRERVREMPDRLETSGTGSFGLTMRRLLHQQVAFQKEVSASFVREAALLGTMSPDHPLRVLFAQHAGLTPEQFIDLSFSLYASVLNRELSLPLDWFLVWSDGTRLRASMRS